MDVGWKGCIVAISDGSRISPVVGRQPVSNSRFTSSFAKIKTASAKSHGKEGNTNKRRFTKADPGGEVKNRAQLEPKIVGDQA